MTNKLIPIIISIVVVIVGVFYGGIKYTENKLTRNGFSQTDFQNLSNLSPEERRQRFQEFGSGDHEGNFRGRFGLENYGTRPLSGEIIVQREGSFTLKLNDGSTKIVFINDSTQIIKSVEGSLGDLNQSEQILVTGDENPDGSYTAEVIQIRPGINH